MVMNKREMRAYIRSLHEGKAVRDEQSAALCRHILDSDAYRKARVIGGYIPIPREADITLALEDALRQGKSVVLPLCGDAPHMTMRRITSLDELVPGKYGIPEPNHEAPIFPVQDIDLLLVPLEGIDRYGFRLGKGGGYYDRFLKLCRKAKRIALAYDCQIYTALPVENHDQGIDAIYTGHHIFK